MKMKLLKFSALFVIILIVLTGCENDTENGDLNAMKLGKNLTITISDDETVDANYLQKILDKEIVKDVPYFDMWDDVELKNLIDYLSINNYVIKPGTYTFNQAWGFDNGMFTLNNGEKREVFKFVSKKID